MEKPLKELTDRVADSAAKLEHRYRARQLHVLRVSIRRIRTYLKHSGAHRARRLRKTWGAFAAVTSEARDWDVFCTTARTLLPPEDYQTFRRLNRKRLRASHQAVKALVVSARWHRHQRDWRAYLKRCAQQARAGDGAPRSLDTALARAGAALAVATELNDDRAWHKFRIAVKETRYIAEATDPRSEHVEQVIATCKALQATLGAWHDTVVQLQLLDELEKHPVHKRLRTAIRRNKKLALSQTRAMLTSQSVFVPT